jgi:Fe(3+) dicitrate transport protein
VPRAPHPRTPTSISRNRVDSADSLALFVQNRFDLSDSLSVTAGLRVESYEQRRKDLRAAGEPVDRFSNTEWLPGLGATYQVNPAVQLYGSAYVAFAPPLVGSVVGSDDVPTEAEKSLQHRLGIRGASGKFSYELAAFQMDFSNQVDPGISGIRAPNEGSALIRGAELSIGYRLGHGFRLDGNLTWIPTAEFGEDRPGEALDGNRLPYSPEWTANLGLAYRAGNLQAALLFNYSGKVYGDGMNRTEIDPLQHMGGLIPSYHTFDLTAGYDFNRNLRLFGAIKNLADKRYIAGLRQGIYAGPERSFDIGLRYQF